MNKSDLVEVLAKRTGITLKKAQEVVDKVFEAMTDTLEQGERIEIRGFGSFSVKEYKPYTGRNPKTKESIHVPPKRLPYFKVGKELKKRVDLHG
ncbi:MAG: HU family DNA-binding protein [Candidatus Alcyoniella australis]|nr:HU family DNA-binding protein [Candidatus Alcyoniella australis]